MKKFPSIMRIPDSITLATEPETGVFSGAQSAAVRDAEVWIASGVVCLRADQTPVRQVILRWNGKMPENARFCGDHWERGYGDLEWRGFVPHRVMPWYFYAFADGAFALYGVKTGPDALCAFQCDPAGITLTLDVSCGADGTVLRGNTLVCAALVCEERETEDPFAAAAALTPMLAQNAVQPPAPVYGYNNWYFAYGSATAEEIFASAEELSALTRGAANRPYIVIDDCWQKERPNGFIGGDWRHSNEFFPDMAALAARIRALDVLPGIWMRPLQNKAADIPRELYRDRNNFLLDPSLDATLDYIAEDIHTLTGWGYRLIKHDYSTADVAGDWGFRREIPLVRNEVHFREKSRTTAQIIKRLYKTIYDAAAGKALILGCNTIGHLGVGYMELNRTGDDTSGREWSRTRKMGVNTLAFRMPQHNAFYAADADCVGITDAVDWSLNRQWMDLLARSGTPLFISVAPGSLTPEKYEEIAKAFASASESRPSAQPLDWMNNCCPARWRFSDGERSYDWYHPDPEKKREETDK